MRKTGMYPDLCSSMGTVKQILLVNHTKFLYNRYHCFHTSVYLYCNNLRTFILNTWRYSVCYALSIKPKSSQFDLCGRLMFFGVHNVHRTPVTDQHFITKNMVKKRKKNVANVRQFFLRLKENLFLALLAADCSTMRETVFERGWK